MVGKETVAQKYVEQDNNLIVETEFPDAADAVFYDVRKEPFELYNFYNPKTQPVFIRYPSEIMDKVGSEKAKHMSMESTGGKIRFSTDSKYILLRAKEKSVARIPHATLAMTAGFDLFEDNDNESRFIRVFTPPYDITDEYTQIIRFSTRKLRYFTVNFPVRSIVSDVFIGVQKDALLGEGKKYPNEKPIVIYGSSIVHGTAASRPGQTYPNMLSRFLNMNVLNMGLSGSALAEIPIMEYLATLDMSVFIYDYDHNAPTVDYLRQTHKRGYEIIRKAKPDVPIIMVSRPDVSTALDKEDVQERKEVIINTYRYAKSKGDKHVYFIDGESFFRGKHENECSMEGVHPNDIGFMFIADSMEAAVKTALSEL